jgi:predicted nucleotidyltransferase
MADKKRTKEVLDQSKKVLRWLSEVKAAVEFLEKCLREDGVTPSKIILFGSQAKGKATRESGIDVVIISEDFRNKDILERAAMAEDAELEPLRNS